MPVLLFSDNDTCVNGVAALAPASRKADGINVLLTSGESALAEGLRAVLPELVVLDVVSPRFARLDFEAVALIVLEAPTDFLLGSTGRRLVEALGRLARDSLALALIGEAGALAGSALLDGVHAGLSLVPGTAVIPHLQAVEDLRGLLATLSRRRTRLLALDAPVGVAYDAARDAVTVGKGSAGSVLLVSFVEGVERSVPTARLHVLTPGMTAGWPE